MNGLPYRAIVLVLLLLLQNPALAGEPQPNPQAREFFEKRVRPVFVERCYKCHGPQSKMRGKLRIDSRASLLKGGESGPAIRAGDPDKSLLIRALRHDGELKMPPRSKLHPRAIADLSAWIKMGAPWPGDGAPTITRPKDKPYQFTAGEKAFWAFQPPRRAPVPSVRNAAWAQSPIDHFVLAKLGSKRLAHAAPASKRVLIRRATFDLTGLPPTPEEVAGFLADDSPDAFARVVDRLLASPRYGERWGRHWLDVARYADSNGMDENLVQANAYHYRDYVIAAFNEDKPYDQFVREQLAGDLLPQPRIVATGFLSLGPKMLAEDDPRKMQLNIVDEQIDTMGRAFMGLTLGCARCHDHKFDPIPTADYYSLAGIFKSTKTMDNFKVVARWHERPLASGATTVAQKTIDAKSEEIAALERTARDHIVTEARRKVDRYVATAREVIHENERFDNWKSTLAAPMGANSPDATIIEAESYQRGNVKKDHTGYGAKIGVIYNKGELPNVAEYDVMVAKAGRYQLELRYAAAAARPVRLFVNGRCVNAKSASKVTGSWYPPGQRWFVEGAFALKAGKNSIRLECDGPFPHFDKLALLPCAANKTTPRTTEQIAREYRLNPLFLRRWADLLRRRGEEPSGPELQKLTMAENGPFALSDELAAHYPDAIKSKLTRLRDELASLQRDQGKVPMVMAVTEGAIENLRVHRRGNYLTLGAEAPRQFPQILAGEKQKRISAKESGRRQLAEWLTRTDHPLTSRVMVNRIWQWHFGEGLVRTPDNFGRLGDRPSHPELLDWLAVRFVESGWSIKAMHRSIMLSGTYQTSATFNPNAAQIDPDNRLLWRFNRRRLSAEELRDTLLALGGSLDLEMGGSLMTGKNRGYVPGYPNNSYDKYASRRRSVHLPVIRSDLYQVFQAFDFADPSTPNGKRATTTVTPQALFAMNSKLVGEQSMQLAKRLLGSDCANDSERVMRLYQLAYSRPVTGSESDRALRFVARVERTLADEKIDAGERRRRAWQSLCRVVLASSELIHVE